MSSIPTLAGIQSEMIQTDRLQVHTLSCGPQDGIPVLFIHGNGSSATFWEETMLALPSGLRAVAPDMRGYGDTQPLPIDATLGLDDMVQDVIALVNTLGIKRHHVVGHSMGGGIAMKYLMANAANIMSMTLVDPMSPYGYAGSKDAAGTPCYDDGAPAGAGAVNPDFVRLVGEKERGAENQVAPLNVLRQFYVKPPFVPAREDDLLSSLLAMRVGDDWYPGDAVPSENWPTLAPGTKGVANAFSRKYFDASDFVKVDPKPPVLWVRGADDLIISNNALWDIAALGAMGVVPGWPGAEACPPQPMLDQTRAVLDKYQANGGTYTEVVIEDAGHSPFIEKPSEFNAVFHKILS